MKTPTLPPTGKMAFSNSTEGECWTSKWCDRCIHDKPAREGREEDACAIFLIALCGQTPGEWIEESPGSLSDRYRCTEFELDPEAES